MEKYIDVFISRKHFYDEIGINISHYISVTISLILSLIKWSEMDPNVKPQTLVETFDQANSNSIPACHGSPKLELTSSKRHIKTFHVVVMQGRQRNVPKRVLNLYMYPKLMKLCPTSSCAKAVRSEEQRVCSSYHPALLFALFPPFLLLYD